MNKTAGLCSLVILLIALPACDAISAITVPPQEPVVFEPQIYPELDPDSIELIGTEPIFMGGGFGAWDESVGGPGAILYYDGLFHMFYSGGQGVGYAISLDGFDWHRVVDGPILQSSDFSYSFESLRASSALVTKNGELVMYFSTLGTPEVGSLETIGRATASAPDGPWLPDPQPVLQPGPAGSWDGYRVFSPDIVITSDGLRMYFGAVDFAGSDRLGETLGEWAIGAAYSPDGLNWEKQNDPETGDDRLDLSDPVLTLEDLTLDNAFVTSPRVWQTPDGWSMLFQQDFNSLSYATSPDGLNWSSYEGNPIFNAWEELDGVLGIFSPELVYYEGQFFIYFAVFGENIPDAIYAATARPAE
jgi:hypothetical protein